MADAAGELLALCDAVGRPLADAARRDVVHRDGLWHRAFHCWVVRSGRHGAELVLQRRAPTKTTWPGAWDVSAAGHLQAGEDLAGGCREIAEELWLHVAPGDLVFVGRHREALRFASGLHEREYQDVYLLRRDEPLVDYAPDPGEVTGLAAVSAPLLVSPARGHVAHLRAAARVWGDGAWAERQVILRRPALVTRAGRYYERVARAAQRLARGSS